MKTSDKPSLNVLQLAFAQRRGVLLEFDEKGALLCCRADSAFSIITDACRHCGEPLHIQALNTETFNRHLNSHHDEIQDGAKQIADGAAKQLEEGLDIATLAEQLPPVTDLMEQRDDDSISHFINAILTEAMKAGASDVHLEVFEKYLSVRLRVDGILREILRPHRELGALLISCIKSMAKLDTAEHYLPQGDCIALIIDGHNVNVRVSIQPSSQGVRVILRLLDKEAGNLDLSQLGMSVQIRQWLESSLYKSHGILLVTGPSGSGKTTTLYAGLTSLNCTERSIFTIEDPVENYLNGISQTQVNTKMDTTFASGFNSILKQAPDVMMVGEIRDGEIADMTVWASLTGHLVLTSLQANSAIGAITHLLDIGVAPFLLCTSLLGVLSQRLVRKLCPACKRVQLADATACAQLGVPSTPPPRIYLPNGCAKCRHTGYQGREGIYELIQFDSDLLQLILKDASELQLLQHVHRSNPDLFSDGRRKVLLGITSLEELLRVMQKS
jgi:general secretion pathway protein E